MENIEPQIIETGNGPDAGLPAPSVFEVCGNLPEPFDRIEISPYRGETYYEIPPVRQSHYEWKTATAFLLNGIAGGSQILATALDLLGGESDRGLIRAGRYTAFLGGTSSALMLISSLHNPRRWYNMLRIFKKTSPMSIGIWAITPFTALSSMTVAGQVIEDLGYENAGRWIGRAFSLPAAVLGGFVISYMGTELEETNMPFWAGSYPLMAPLYSAFGLSNSAAAILAASEFTEVSQKTRRNLNRLALISGGAELALATLSQSRWKNSPEAAGFEFSPYSTLFRFAYIGLGLSAPLLMRLYSEVAEDSPAGAISGFFAKLLGGWAMQLSLVYGGRESGKQARDYFEFATPRKLNGREVEKPEKRQSDGTNSMLFGLGVLAMGAGIFYLSSRGKEVRGNESSNCQE